MIYSSKDMESRAVLDTAAKICAAARTAPKTRGMDGLVTCVLTGENKSQLGAGLTRAVSTVTSKAAPTVQKRTACARGMPSISASPSAPPLPQQPTRASTAA